MRFLSNGPDIPDKLLSLQEKGQVIFICGAGVSRMAGLPSFRGLVAKVYEALGEDWEQHPAEREVMRDGGVLAHQYDRMLRSLEKRLAASDLPRNSGMRQRIRTAVRQALSLTTTANLANHLALLELSRDEGGQSRLLTTNFDTLFERAWYEQYHEAIVSHAHVAMPQPRVSGFRGVLHLHGRLADVDINLGLSETDLVLTSAEFGDAYLRSGWASRYVYDVVRAYTVVLVGYEADDPPMRYLLEVLEADRERYPDLNQVYAFASCEVDDEELQTALWRAKGVEAILYRPVAGDHSPLYETMRKWREYAIDPTAWRTQELRAIFALPPDDQAAIPLLPRCGELLTHGDASQILGDLLPSPDWMPRLLELRVFGEHKAHAGLWIAGRLNDADMIRASVGLPSFTDGAAWYLERALEQQRDALTLTRLKAWDVILKSKRVWGKQDFAHAWYGASQYIRQGEAGHDYRQIIRRMLQPRLNVAKVWRTPQMDDGDEEGLHNLVRIEFKASRHPPPSDILNAWPANLKDEVALFKVLERALFEALEEAADIGFLDDRDAASADVPSVATHRQNAHRSGFYPLVRTIADLWERIVQREGNTARMLVSGWTDSHYLLVRRLGLFTLCSTQVFSAQEAFTALKVLNDEMFWTGRAQVEIMRLAALRWREFTPEDRDFFEDRIRQGLPRDLFAEDAFDDEERWDSIRDRAAMNRLTRLLGAGGPITLESQALLDAIRARHPNWVSLADDRGDFSVWFESHSGPDGQPELLKGADDASLVAEAMRLQQDRQFDQGDIWSAFCRADPERALRGLRHAAGTGQWNVGAWRDFIWALFDKDDKGLQREFAAQLLVTPSNVLVELLAAACSWLQKRYQVLAASSPLLADFLAIWDKLADLAYPTAPPPDENDEGQLFDKSLNAPAGILARSLVEFIALNQPAPSSGFLSAHASRLSLAVRAAGMPGLLASVALCRSLAYLDSIDHEWTVAALFHHLAWDHPQAAAMWHARAYDHIGSARLFNALKAPMLKAFESPLMSDNDREGLFAHLLAIAFWHRRGAGTDYNLSTGEIKRVLASGPEDLRAHASWHLWRCMGDASTDAQSKADHWRQVIAPVFGEIWPLDAAFRSETSSRNFVLMALECGDAFPDAVEAVIDFLVPYELYHITHSLRLDPAHDALITEFPRAAVRLANALIDPAAYPVPRDLAEFLQICAEADPGVTAETSYIRLFGLRRQIAA